MIYKYLCVYHTHTNARAHTHTHTQAFNNTHTHTHTHTHTQTHTQAFNNTSQYHFESEQAEKTLNVDQFQHVLHALLIDKELTSEQGNLNRLAIISEKSCTW